MLFLHKDKLSPMQHLVASHLALGKTILDVAKIANISQHTIYRWNSSKLFQDRVNELAEQGAAKRVDVNSTIDEELLEAGLVATRKLVKLMNSAKSEEVQRKAAIDLMYQIGRKPKDKMEVDHRTPALIMSDATAEDEEGEEEHYYEDEEDEEDEENNDYDHGDWIDNNDDNMVSEAEQKVVRITEKVPSYLS